MAEPGNRVKMFLELRKLGFILAESKLWAGFDMLADVLGDDCERIEQISRAMHNDEKISSSLKTIRSLMEGIETDGK